MLEHFKKHWKAADDEFVALDEVSRPNGAGAGVSGWTNNVVASLDFLASKKSLDIDGFKGWLLQVSGYLSKATFDKAMAEMTAIVSKSVSTKLLFKAWDVDGSGSLDFAEIGVVLKWFQENVPGEIDFARLFATLEAPKDGLMTFEAFDKWMLDATSGMSVLSYTTVTEKLKDHLRDRGIDPNRAPTRKPPNSPESTQHV